MGLGCLGWHARDGEGWSLLENLTGPLLLPLVTPLTLAPFPVLRELRAGRDAYCQLVVVQPPEAKGRDARWTLPPRWEHSRSCLLFSS